jgi:preprotein translocase subunit SecE
MAEKKVGFFGSIARYFRELKSEIKKIVWPTRQTVFRNTGVVLTSILVVGLFVFGLDSALYALLGKIMNLAKVV